MCALIGKAYAKDTLCSDKTVQDELVEALVMDAETLKDQTLQEHDRIHHKEGYHEGDTCKFRDKIKEETPEDQADELSLGKVNRQSSKDNKQQVKLTDLANRIKGFIKGVKIRFSETPYQEDGREVRKSIRENEQKNWNKILDAFENKTAGADATFHHQLLDHTPAVYQRLGVKDLPITIMGGVIHKMIGNIRNSEYDYHEIPISELRNLLIDLDNPVAVFDSTSDPNAFVVLTNILDKHGNLKSVVPLKLERDTSGKAKENAIASGYGQKPENMQNWIDGGYLRYVNKKALRKSAQRLQLPGDSILRAKGVLMENDFSSEQLGDIIPDSEAAVKGVDEKKEGVGEVINLRDSKGKVVGTYNRKTNEMVVYPGADADTIGHELCGHATWQYAEQQARKGDSRLLEKMQEVVDAPAAKPVWDEVKANYEGEDRAVQREEVWAHIIGHQTSKAIEEIQKSRSGRRWYQKFWNVVKDAWKGLLSTIRINSVHLEGTEEMSPKEFSEYIVKQMLERKTLGELEKGGEGGERKSIIGKKGAEKLGIGKLDEAEKMEKEGVDRKEIWQKTGWWRGKDEEWRVEIPDLAPRGGEFWPTINKVNHDKGEVHLGDVLEDGPMFEAYPKLKNVRLDLIDGGKRVRGSAHADSISISRKITDEMELGAVLAHELQHMIQDEEGFSKGGNPTQFKLEDKERNAKTLAAITIKLCAGQPDDNGEPMTYESAAAKLLTESAQNSEEDVLQGRAYESILRSANIEEEIKRIIDDSERHYDSPYERYKSLAGEVEARNVAERRFMTEEERSATPPWETEDIPEEKQVVKKGFSIPRGGALRWMGKRLFLRNMNAKGIHEHRANLILDHIAKLGSRDAMAAEFKRIMEEEPSQ